jgi:flavin reductase (DIM6/NTAB) family NADH-FMN oxidoreductase RutF
MIKNVLSATSFKNALSSIARTVSVITTCVGDEYYGFTASSVTGVSIDPMLISFCAYKSSFSLGALQKSGVFVINVLADDSMDIALQFANKNISRFESTEYFIAKNMCPVLSRNLCYFECSLMDQYYGGDHEIVLGSVTNLAFDKSAHPLIHYKRNFYTLNIEGIK